MRDVIHCLRGTDFCPLHPFRGTIWGQNYEKNMKTGRQYGEKEKIQILIKSLIFRTLRIYIFSFYTFLFLVSFADAECLFPHTEPLKDIPEDFVGGDFAEDGAEVVEGLAEVFGEEVGSLAGGEGTFDVFEGFGRFHQGLVVP